MQNNNNNHPYNLQNIDIMSGNLNNLNNLNNLQKLENIHSTQNINPPIINNNNNINTNSNIHIPLQCFLNNQNMAII